MKQLIIGPRLNKDGVTIGGSEVLFENWLSFCKDRGLDFEVIDANKFNYPSLSAAMRHIIKEIWKRVKHCDVIFFHGSKNDYFFISPVIAMAAKFYGKPYYMKKFGGDFDHEYNDAPGWKKCGVRWAMKNAAGLYWETKRLMHFGKKFNDNCVWCPNTRVKTNVHRNLDEPYKKKFVFMSHVRKEKGIDETLEAFRRLGPEYSLDIYGTLMGYTPEQLDGRYKGVVESKDVPNVLSQYQLLLLSSWKEGYPGIIIEAFGAGLPVVASKAGGIPEMVTDGENGLLCEPHSAEDIVEAIKRLDGMDLKKLSHKAYNSFEIYDGDKVNAQILDELTKSCKR